MELMQWPAMGATVLSAWMVASSSARKRRWGFWCFLVSNVLWTLWGMGDRAWAIVVMQVFLAALNIRGVAKYD